MYYVKNYQSYNNRYIDLFLHAFYKSYLPKFKYEDYTCTSWPPVEN